MQKKRPVVLLILDGWGLNEEKNYNAVAQAATPFWDSLLQKYSHCSLQASGEAVGLPAGQMGNSEVGHLNIGSGRIIYQDFTEINRQIEEGSFFTNPVLLEAMQKAKEPGCKLHFIGLLSDGGVHSHIRHLKALLKMAKAENVSAAYVHAFLDGRDVPPSSAGQYLDELSGYIKEHGYGAIASISGRYYAMDRDKRWERTELALQALTKGEGRCAASAREALNYAYRHGETDEFVVPTVLTDNDGEPVACIDKNDVVVFFNFRPDRARQITEKLQERQFYCFTEYDSNFALPVVFAQKEINNTLGEALSHAGLKQLRIAETEKYAHVTFFFNGGREEPYEGEDRILIPSPKVATYDLQPEMSALEVTAKAVEVIDSGVYDVIIQNYANPDMVGHTGNIEATVKAIETIDSCLQRLVAAVLKQGGCLLITADHGNAEKMLDSKTKEPYTAHTDNKVPLVLVDEDYSLRPDGGILADLAPTVLDLLHLNKPEEMTGATLLTKN